MKVRSVALLSALGMTLTSFSVYSWTTRGPAEEVIEGARDGVAVELGGDEDETTEVASAGATFTAGSTLMVEGRLGHARLARDGRGETFVMLEVRGTDQGSVSARAPVSLSVVVDRSGSMRGARLDNAIRGTLAAIDRLRDGDRVSVVAFDTRPTVIVPPTTIDYRVGDTVFTHPGIVVHSIPPGSRAENLWLLIAWPESMVSGTNQTVAIGLAGGRTATFLASAVPAELARQNELRADYGLPPLPDPASVAHGAPAEADEPPMLDLRKDRPKGGDPSDP